MSNRIQYKNNDELQYKSIGIDDFKAEKAEDGFYVTGICNTKNKEDAYGDRPTKYQGKDVYDLSRYRKNPILLVNHDNNTSSVIGVMADIKETDKGLEFKAKLMENPQSEIAKHAIQGIKEGFIRALSIGGKWKFEDPKNPSHLTNAYIHEVSFCGVGADAHALTDMSIPKSMKTQETIATQIEEAIAKKDLALMESLIQAFRDSK